tara:strand:- start:915 stop:1265 length:351 start_codon:yes stop_codon:yes gene_type:complete
MPIYTYTCSSCGENEDHLVSYEKRTDDQDCNCGQKMKYEFSACAFKPSVGGAHKGRLIAPDVGPLSKKSKAWQKKMDDKNSQFYAPGMHGSMTASGRKDFNYKAREMAKGNGNFTK